MLENLLFSLNVVAPTFLTALVGFFLKRLGFFTDEFLKPLDKYIFTFALPALMIKDISSSNITEMFSAKFALLCFLGTTFMFMGFWAISYPFFKDKNFSGVFAQSSARGSIAVFGASIATSIYGSVGVTPFMMAIAVPLYNIYSVILLSLKSDGKEKLFTPEKAKKMLHGIATNPLIIGIVIGAFFSLTKITIPQPIVKTISGISATGTPMALLSLGAGIKIDDMAKRIKPVLASCFLKLVGFGAILIPLTAAMGFRQDYIIAILLMTSAPATVSSYIMAKNMGADHTFASAVVMVSTILAAFTMTAWLTVLKTAGLI